MILIQQASIFGRPTGDICKMKEAPNVSSCMSRSNQPPSDALWFHFSSQLPLPYQGMAPSAIPLHQLRPCPTTHPLQVPLSWPELPPHSQNDDGGEEEAEHEEVALADERAAIGLDSASAVLAPPPVAEAQPDNRHGEEEEHSDHSTDDVAHLIVHDLGGESQAFLRVVWVIHPVPNHPIPLSSLDSSLTPLSSSTPSLVPIPTSFSFLPHSHLHVPSALPLPN